MKNAQCYSLLAASILAISINTSPSFAGALDGLYASNRGNSMRIVGNRYEYIPKIGGHSRPGGGRIVRLADGRYEFHGRLHYACDFDGKTFTCTGRHGLRTWTRY